MPIIGIDVSKWNYGWAYDNAQKPIDFIIQRASWSGYKDEKFDAMLPETMKVGVRGAYHYYSSGVNWKYQADLFLSVVKDKGFHFYVLDYETAYNELNGRTIAEASEFVRYVKQQTGKNCMFYFSPNVFNTYIKPFGYTNWVNQQSVWIAQYPWSLTQTPPYSSPRLPSGLNVWTIWQHGASDVSFTTGRHAGPDYGQVLQGCDLNYFNGTIDELYAWAGATEQPPVDPPPVVEPDSRPGTVMVSPSINIRSGPATTFPISQPSKPTGTKVNIYEEKKDIYGNTWGRITNPESNWGCMVYLGMVYIKYDEVVVPPPVTDPNLVTVTATSLNVRSGAGIEFSVVGSMQHDNKATVLEYKRTYNGVWGRIGESAWICLLLGTITFTDKTDFSNVPPYVPPTTLGLYRIKDDLEAGVEPTGTRPYIRNGLPSTVRIWGGTGFVLLSNAWMGYLVKINNTDRSLKYQFVDWRNPVALKKAVGWHNFGPDNRVEELTFSGNIVEVTEIVGDKAYIKTYFNNETPPSTVYLPMPNSLNKMVHMFTTQYTGYLDMTTDSRYPRTFLIGNPGERLYMNLRDLVKI